MDETFDPLIPPQRVERAVKLFAAGAFVLFALLLIAEGIRLP